MKHLTPISMRPGLSLGELLEQLEGSSFGARSPGNAWRVLRGILEDPGCRVLLTVSGALSVAQFGSVFREMLAGNILHAVVTTGAVITHQLVQELGPKRLRAPAGIGDASLVQKRLNRVYDCLEPESNLEALERFVAGVAGGLYGQLGSSAIVRRLAQALPDRSGWLAQSDERDVPVFVPALTDSELGLALYANSGAPGKRRFRFDPMADLDEFATWLSHQERIAVITLGGGVPRNWAMQMVPYLKGRREPYVPQVIAGIRICPDPPEYGHLSGSTYSEATTWGKLDGRDLGNFAEVLADATIVFPILILAALSHRSDPLNSR